MSVKLPTTMKFRGMDWYVGDQSGNVSQFDPTYQVAQGMQYLPDEVAKEMVDALELKKSHTVSKDTIVKYLESLGLSGTLAPEVAMVLRTNYGVTPIFYEEKPMYQRSGKLIEELMGVMDESYPAPFIDKGPEVLTEGEAIARVAAEELAEATDDEQRFMIREFSKWSLDEMNDFVELAEDFGEDGVELLQDCFDAGGSKLMEQVVEAVYRPHLARFMSEDVRNIAEDAMTMLALKKGAKSDKPIDTKKLAAKLSSQYASRVDTGKSGRSKSDYAATMAKISPENYKKASRMKKVAGKAGMMMRRVGGGLAKAAGAAGKGIAVAGKAAVGGTAGLAGHAAGSYAKAKAKAMAGSPAEVPAAAQRSSEPAKEKKPGLLRRLLGGVKKFAGKVSRVVGGAAKGGADAVKKEFPGVTHAASSLKDKFNKGRAAGERFARGERAPKKVKEKKKEKPAGIELGPAGGRRGGMNPLGATEDVDPFFAELASALGCHPSDVEIDGGVPDPANIGERLYAQDVVDKTVVESLSHMGWNEIAEVANIMMLDPQHTLQLFYALREGVLPYRREWNSLTESASIPIGLDRDSIPALGRVTLDEGVVPKALFWASRFLQEAHGTDVEGHVRESYPELGSTVYGPAGDPTDGPHVARDYMTPHMAGVDSPDKEAHVLHTRHFTDPSERAQKRNEMRKEVESIIGQMADAAETAGVAPEGMFLNKWRDMHRERVRYS